MSGAAPAHWVRQALDPVRAYGAPPARGRLRAVPEDFIVDEQLGFEPDGDGSHWLLRVRKRGANTEYVARELARHAGAALREVGFAGLKDRHAVATQWFTVPRGQGAVAAQWPVLHHAEFEVVEVHAHRRKLRRGALSGNAFRVRIRDCAGDRAAIGQRLAGIGERGAPNYFGEQRFGREGHNLQRVAAWVGGGRLPADRGQRSFTLSAARSLIFNAILQARVHDGTWDRLLAGDVANLDGSGSVFPVSEVDDTLAARAHALDVHPTAPLWGSGTAMSAGAVHELEETTARSFEPLPSLLAAAGASAERRSLRVKVAGLQATWEHDDLLLAFRLPPGAFATTVLRECLEAPQ